MIWLAHLSIGIGGRDNRNLSQIAAEYMNFGDMSGECLFGISSLLTFGMIYLCN